MLSYVFVLKFYFLLLARYTLPPPPPWKKNVVLDITEQKQKNLKFQ